MSGRSWNKSTIFSDNDTHHHTRLQTSSHTTVTLEEKRFNIFQDILLQSKAHMAALISENEIFKLRNWHLLADRQVLDKDLEELIKVVVVKFREEKNWNSINESLLDLQNLVLIELSLMDLDAAKIKKAHSSYESSETENPSTGVKTDEQQATNSELAPTQEKRSREYARKAQQISEEFNLQSLRENSEPIRMPWKSPVQTFIDKFNAQEMIFRARLAKICELGRTIQDFERQLYPKDM